MDIKKIAYLLLIAYTSMLISASISEIPNSYKVKPIRMTIASDKFALGYKDVYNPLFQAVFEGDLEKFEDSWDAFKSTIHDRLSYNRTIRHFAFHPLMNAKLLEHRVAPTEEVQIRCISAEDALYYESSGRRIPLHVCKYKRFALNPDGCDIYDKHPEGYTFEQRKEMAKSMIIDLYTGPIR